MYISGRLKFMISGIPENLRFVPSFRAPEIVNIPGCVQERNHSELYTGSPPKFDS